MAVAGQADGVGKVGVADGQPADPVGSPDLLRLLADSIPAAVFIKDLQGRYRLVNRAAAAASHRTAADMIGRTDEELFPSAVAARLRAYDAETLRADRTETVEETVAAEGALVRHLVTKIPCRDAAGRLTGLLGIARDITVRGADPGPARPETARLTGIIELQQAVLTAGLEPDEVMQRIADSSRDLLSAAGAAVLLVDGQGLTFRSTSGMATRVQGVRVPVSGSLAGETLEHGLPARADDTEADPRVHRATTRRLGCRSILTVPLRDGRRAVGVLTVMHHQPAAFGEADEQVLLLIGGMLSAALARALSFDANRRLLEERTATLSALRGSEERLQSAMRAARIGVWDWDLRSQEITWLGEHESMLGFGPGEFDGRYESFMARVHPEDRAALDRAITAAITGLTEYTHSFRVVWGDGSVRWLTGRGQVHGDADGAPTRMVGAVTDITARRALEHQVLQAQKIEAIGQLAAGIAHEINTPTQYVGDNLRFLQGAYGDLITLLTAHRALAAEATAAGLSVGPVAELWEGVDADFVLEEVPRAVAQALEGVERVSEIVRAMKEFSHPGGNDPVPVDLNRAIENTAAVSRNEWKYLADLEFDLDAALPPVSCLVGEIQQVLLNLVVNAAHAIGDVVQDSGERGRITIRTRVRDEVVEIRVEDSGTGIPAAVQPRIFDPFFTTKEVGRGTGQGLAIARDVVVRKHRGTLTFETTPGQGTTFIVRLPLHPDDDLRERA
ncbi:MAG: PAS domain-containing protein [Gemmatimonadales bacterium]